MSLIVIYCNMNLQLMTSMSPWRFESSTLDIWRLATWIHLNQILVFSIFLPNMLDKPISFTCYPLFIFPQNLKPKNLGFQLPFIQLFYFSSISRYLSYDLWFSFSIQFLFSCEVQKWFWREVWKCIWNFLSIVV